MRHSFARLTADCIGRSAVLQIVRALPAHWVGPAPSASAARPAEPLSRPSAASLKVPDESRAGCTARALLAAPIADSAD
jgi:hypothetical protein